MNDSTDRTNKETQPDGQEQAGPIVRDSHGRFLKGYSGNPAGNTKNRGIEQLTQAIKSIETKHGIDYFEEIVERSRTDNTLAAALLRKLIPDRKAVEAEISAEPFTQHTTAQEEMKALEIRLARLKRMRELPSAIDTGE